MNITKPIVFFDLETTGLNTQQDRIVEICMIKVHPDGEREELYSRVNPTIPVPERAAEIHGLDDVMLSMEPTFAEIAPKVKSFIEGCDLGGYNIVKFDIPLLSEELSRAGINHSFRQHKVFDSYLIWVKCESRDLTGAVKRFLGEDMVDAHRAKADVEATGKILMKQLKEFGDAFESASELADETSGLKDKLDFAGKFVKNDNNQIVITFGKHKDKPVQQINTEDNGYLKWMFEVADFPTETKLLAKQIYEKLQTK